MISTTSQFAVGIIRNREGNVVGSVGVTLHSDTGALSATVQITGTRGVAIAGILNRADLSVFPSVILVRASTHEDHTSTVSGGGYPRDVGWGTDLRDR